MHVKIGILGALGILLAGCSPSGEPASPGVIHLTDLLGSPGKASPEDPGPGTAPVSGPLSGSSGGGAVEVGRWTLAGIGMEAVGMRGGGEFSVRLGIPDRAVLRFSAAALDAPESGAIEVVARTSGEEVALHRAEIGREGHWEAVRVDLAAFSGSETEIVFRARGMPETRLLVGAPVVTGPRGERRNVLLYEVDTVRADALETYGFPGPSSPALTRAARQGAVFAECYSTSSWTRPAAVSILTSQSPLAHGVLRESLRLPEEARTLPEILRREGYFTVAFLMNPNAGRAAGLDQGFDLVFEPDALIDFVRQRPEGFRGRRFMSTGNPSGTSERIAYVFRHWFPEYRDLPLFLYIHPTDPHAPYDPREPFASVPDLVLAGTPERVRGAVSRYGGDVRAADHFFGEVLGILEEAELLDRTAVVFTSDHGEEFWDHGRMGHGLDLWTETLRVPLVLRAPWAVPRGVVFRGRVSVVDILPTLLELAGVSRPAATEGSSLLRLIGGGGSGERFPPEPAFAHLLNLKMRLDEEVMADPEVVGEIAVLRGPWKCVVRDYGSHAKRKVWLVDMREDPGELRDVAARHPERAREMEALARAWYEAGTAGAGGKGEAAEIDPESAEQLRALGYLR